MWHIQISDMSSAPKLLEELPSADIISHHAPFYVGAILP